VAINLEMEKIGTIKLLFGVKLEFLFILENAEPIDLKKCLTRKAFMLFVGCLRVEDAVGVSYQSIYTGAPPAPPQVASSAALGRQTVRGVRDDRPAIPESR
jgi:hypothetical protein